MGDFLMVLCIFGGGYAVRLAQDILKGEYCE